MRAATAQAILSAFKAIGKDKFRRFFQAMRKTLPEDVDAAEDM